eukprot:CAMPEP_0114410042 /NCGR_PEP_ID=MMETSP0102-20121206/23793_1 /TAXON_ID=38822 ORGANISM="Pteridomonas danica, Strain PT" /NCGR_SAMPLE_ID=MMETSP0102 /ASSEMBLY_ACC=CAM_ASM_000212 /LENGTH=241 /DNA_ID=CAMNT_0001577607 /DNA_START=59 /DNA_END=784 /DNA_ORIENTATION=+
MSRILSKIDMSAEPTVKQSGFNLVVKIVSNILANPKEPKFRRINLEGKAGAKLVAVPELVEFLVSNGFVEADGHLEFPEDASMERIMVAKTVVESFISSTAAQVQPSTSLPVPTANLSLKQKALLQQENLSLKQKALLPTANLSLKQKALLPTANLSLKQKALLPTANLSLKQKALLQQEEKKLEARKVAKKTRQEELSKIEQDKLVRQKDENWSAQAAGVKGGKPIETYRGKFGEDQGGG